MLRTADSTRAESHDLAHGRTGRSARFIHVFIVMSHAPGPDVFHGVPYAVASAPPGAPPPLVVNSVLRSASRGFSHIAGVCSLHDDARVATTIATDSEETAGVHRVEQPDSRIRAEANAHGFAFHGFLRHRRAAPARKSPPRLPCRKLRVCLVARFSSVRTVKRLGIQLLRVARPGRPTNWE